MQKLLLLKYVQSVNVNVFLFGAELSTTHLDSIVPDCFVVTFICRNGLIGKFNIAFLISCVKVYLVIVYDVDFE